MSDAALLRLVRAIAAREGAFAKQLLQRSPELARARLAEGATRQRAGEFFLEHIRHYVMEGDTALHIAAAAYDVPTARLLVRLDADVRAKNRRKAEPIHYAVAGGPGTGWWNPRAQAAMVKWLVDVGADPNTDGPGTTPLLSAIRNRCSAAVRALLECGADPTRKTKAGSSAIKLAELTTGRSASGSREAKAEQAAIVELLRGSGS